VQVNPRLANVQRDENSLFTSRFESCHPSHAVSLREMSKRDASQPV
jgi:glucan phosphoethanolaminetransferase (alkaline phosphatase superfamily)